MSHIQRHLPRHSLSDFAEGDLILWNRESRGGYGFIRRIPGVVVRVTAKRVRIRVKIGGRDAEYSVHPEFLEKRELS